VPCGGCTACCTAAQFVHVGPDEHDALTVIPPELLFPAPGFPAGHVLMGYDDQGRCPMFNGTGCSIYEHRPRTCRTYDCRVFAATDVVPEDPQIAARVARWRFDHPSAADEQAHTELRRQAAADAEPNPTKRAVRVVAG
jgi:Fe-S-cluster containining protein